MNAPVLVELTGETDALEVCVEMFYGARWCTQQASRRSP